jgi:hypothetical protein
VDHVLVKGDSEERRRDIAKLRASMPKSYRKIYDKAVQRISRVAAIKSKCLDCTNWQYLEVRFCTALDCPLWAYRPYQKVRESSRVSKKNTLRKNLP